jgi:hypothetical protein
MYIVLCCPYCRDFPAAEAWAVGSSDLLEHFEDCDAWESAARLFMVRAAAAAKAAAEERLYHLFRN